MSMGATLKIHHWGVPHCDTHVSRSGGIRTSQKEPLWLWRKPVTFVVVKFYLFNFGCTGSLLLRVGFLYWWQAEATLSLLKMLWLLIPMASLIAEHGL